MTTLGWRRIALYLVCFYAALLVPDFMVRYTLNEVLTSMDEVVSWRDKPGLHAKLDHYREHASRYDLLFVGDSRTYCAMAPDLLDPLLGTRSFNLSMFANWFPTQYASLQDLLPYVPDGTTIVWSIGHRNFRKVLDEVGLVYPIGLDNLPTYLAWGYPWPQIRANVLSQIPGLKVFVHRHQIRERVERVFARRLPSRNGTPATAARPSSAAVPAASWLPPPDADPATLLRAYQQAPGVLHVEPLYDSGRVTSLAVYMRAGNYVRVELLPEFFREKQQEFAAELEPVKEPRYTPDPEYWQNFVAIVDLLQSRPIRLVVNEFEEAPYYYALPENRRVYRAFMAEVRAYLEARGIPFIRVDFDRLVDADYFDYNHLNSRGIERFNEMFVEEFRSIDW
jgi:hypothetical protein